VLISTMVICNGRSVFARRWRGACGLARRITVEDLRELAVDDRAQRRRARDRPVPRSLRAR
jgi:hypothetical protein